MENNLRRLDLKTHELTTLPGSEGLFSPRWSLDGRYLAALTSDSRKLMLFDFETRNGNGFSGRAPYSLYTLGLKFATLWVSH